jgi:hypothetical protein
MILNIFKPFINLLAFVNWFEYTKNNELCLHIQTRLKISIKYKIILNKLILNIIFIFSVN